MISKDTLFASQEATDMLPDVILPQANLSSYITTEHGEYIYFHLQFPLL